MYRIFLLVAIATFVSSQSGTEELDDDWLPTGRIVGGERVDISEVPYQVSLQNRGSHFCGGTIISKYYIVTAGHCVFLRPHEIEVLVGSTFRNESGNVHKVSEVIIHSKYGMNREEIPVNDIAIMRVAKPFRFTSKVQPIGLRSSREEIEKGTESIITGWGRINDRSPLSKVLMRVKIPIVTKEYCNTAYRKIGGIPKNQICAAYSDGTKDACQGDSGGPLVIDRRLAGITSWGLGCAVPGQPGVYTEVSAYRDWIRKVTGV